MQINVNRGVLPAGSVPSGRPTTRKAGAHSPENTSQSSEGLDGRLNPLPEVRPEVVERARKLLADPTYPPLPTVHQIARLLASNLAITQEGEEP
jgi:hypothetical protein